MICAVLSERLDGLERIKSGATSRLAKRSPMFGASRLPRSFKGRSLSGNAGSSRLDLAWRTRNSVLTALPGAFGRATPVLHLTRRPKYRCSALAAFAKRNLDRRVVSNVRHIAEVADRGDLVIGEAE